MDNRSISDGDPVSEEHNQPLSQLAVAQELNELRESFRAKLLWANLETEAVRAGMIDLDGLKLIDLAEAQIGPDDRVVGGPEIMIDLKRRKPWLFGAVSSSSVAEVPASKPVRQKNAIEMTDEEYISARLAIIKSRY